MEIDERYCPACGHGVLNWETRCPGCDQIPWNTPIGHRVIAQRRRRQWFADNGLALIFIFGLGFIVALQFHYLLPTATGHHHPLTREVKQLERRLRAARHDITKQQEAVEAVRLWCHRHLPMLLATFQDTQRSLEERFVTVEPLIELLDKKGPLLPIVEASYHQELVDTFRAVLEQKQTSRKLKLAALALLGMTDAKEMDDVLNRHPEFFTVEVKVKAKASDGRTVTIRTHPSGAVHKENQGAGSR